MKKNDFTLPVFEREQIAEHAKELLRLAETYGEFPTPLEKILKTADLQLRSLQELSEHECSTGSIRRAVNKLQGLLYRPDRVVYVDKSMNSERRKFVAIHEVAHDWLPEQRLLYQLIEDSDQELQEDTLDEFERAANCFASDVIFQADIFSDEADKCSFGIGSPVKILSKRFKASIYSTLRRYTLQSSRVAALLVCDVASDSHSLSVRRFISSLPFQQEFGELEWPHELPATHWLCRNRPWNRFFGPAPWSFDAGGVKWPCLVEAYNSTKNIFFFMYAGAGSRIIFS